MSESSYEFFDARNCTRDQAIRRGDHYLNRLRDCAESNEKLKAANAALRERLEFEQAECLHVARYWGENRGRLEAENARLRDELQALKTERFAEREKTRIREASATTLKASYERAVASGRCTLGAVDPGEPGADRTAYVFVANAAPAPLPKPDHGEFLKALYRAASELSALAAHLNSWPFVRDPDANPFLR